jgi:hypothetical protein
MQMDADRCSNKRESVKPREEQCHATKTMGGNR